MKNEKTETKSRAALAEIIRLREALSTLHDQAVKLEALARDAYADVEGRKATDKLPDAGAYALARIAVLEAENAAQREQLVKTDRRS